MTITFDGTNQIETTFCY